MSVIDTAYDLQVIIEDLTSWQGLIEAEGLFSLGEEVDDLKDILKEIKEVNEDNINELVDSVINAIEVGKDEDVLLAKLNKLIDELIELEDEWQIEEDVNSREDKGNEFDFNRWLNNRII